MKMTENILLSQLFCNKLLESLTTSNFTFPDGSTKTLPVSDILPSISIDFLRNNYSKKQIVL